MKNIYIGFAIDMDGAAHNKINSTGGIIPETHPKYDFYTNEMNVFLEGMDKLFNFFDKYNSQKAATWFVNEFAFKTSKIYPELIDKCIKLGELGLHTHFDAHQLGGQGRYITENKADWFEEGLQIPTNDLQNILNKYNKKLMSFKAGCHLRNNEMFDAIGELGYIYDTTMVYEDTLVDPDGNVRYDDTQLECGTLPFYIKTKNNYRLLEIPEIRPNLHKVKKHIDNTPEDAPIFIRLQVHPFDVINIPTFLGGFDRVIEYCRSVGNVEFKNIEEMGDLFIDYEMKKMSDKMLNEYKFFCLNDTYYIDRNLKKKFWKEQEIYIIKYVFNNFNKSNIFITDCFAGWGQVGLILNKLGYTNIKVLEFDQDRVNIGKEIAKKEKCNNITFICDDFFKNTEILKSQLFISVNSVNGSLDGKYDKQTEIYNKMFDNNGEVIMDISRYGNENNGNKFFNYFTKQLNFNKIDLNYNFKHLFNKNKITYTKKNLSNFFEKLYSIATDNILINEINDNYNDLISTNLIFNNDEIKGSAGVFFSFPISFLAKYNYELPIQKYKFSFNARITKKDSDFRLKIYTGFKYVILEKELSEKYQEFILEDEFNFNKASTYRIGFVNPKKGIELFINNPEIEIC
jgi:hypothetical protein